MKGRQHTRSPHDRLLRTASTLPTRRFVSNRIDLRVLGSAAGAFTIFGASPYEKREWRRGESNQLWTIENLLQDAWLPAIVPKLLSSTSAPFHAVPPRFAENRGGEAHMGHKNPWSTRYRSRQKLVSSSPLRLGRREHVD